MTNRRTLNFSILAAAVSVMFARSSSRPWNRYPDSQRNRDNGRSGRYDDRYVRDSVHRLDRLAKDFEREVDRSLDRQSQRWPPAVRTASKVRFGNSQCRDDLKSAWARTRSKSQSNEAHGCYKKGGNLTE